MDINSILLKGGFGTDGFSFGIGDNRRGVDTVGLFPDYQSVLPQHFHHHFGWHMAECIDGGYSHGAQQSVGFFAYARDFAYRKWPQERNYPFGGNFKFPVGLGYASGYFAYCFVYRKSQRNRQTCFTDNALPEVVCPFHATEKAVHAGNIEVMFVDTGFFVHRRTFGNNIGYHVGVFGVLLHIAAHHSSIGAQHAGHFHRHGRMHPEHTCFVAATRYYAAV